MLNFIFHSVSGVLNSSRSGLNILCKQGKCKDSKVNRVRRNFLNDRVTLKWNKLPTEVKISSSLNVFKSNLELFKCKTKALLWEYVVLEIFGKCNV